MSRSVHRVRTSFASFLMQGLRLTAMGLLLGLVLAFGLTRFIAGMLLWDQRNRPTHSDRRSFAAGSDGDDGLLPARTSRHACESGIRDSRAITAMPSLTIEMSLDDLGLLVSVACGAYMLPRLAGGTMPFMRR